MLHVSVEALEHHVDVQAFRIEWTPVNCER